MAWSLVTLEKWFSRMVTVPVRATWPHPQNRATPEKQRIVATSDAYGTPPKHLMQHSKQPVHKQKNMLLATCDSMQRSKVFYIFIDANPGRAMSTAHLDTSQASDSFWCKQSQLSHPECCRRNSADRADVSGLSFIGFDCGHAWLSFLPFPQSQVPAGTVQLAVCCFYSPLCLSCFIWQLITTANSALMAIQQVRAMGDCQSVIEINGNSQWQNKVTHMDPSHPS